MPEGRPPGNGAACYPPAPSANGRTGDVRAVTAPAQRARHQLAKRLRRGCARDNSSSTTARSRSRKPRGASATRKKHPHGAHTSVRNKLQHDCRASRVVRAGSEAYSHLSGRRIGRRIAARRARSLSRDCCVLGASADLRGSLAGLTGIPVSDLQSACRDLRAGPAMRLGGPVGHELGCSGRDAARPRTSAHEAPASMTRQQPRHPWVPIATCGSMAMAWRGGVPQSSLF